MELGDWLSSAVDRLLFGVPRWLARLTKVRGGIARRLHVTEAKVSEVENHLKALTAHVLKRQAEEAQKAFQPRAEASPPVPDPDAPPFDDTLDAMQRLAPHAFRQWKALLDESREVYAGCPAHSCSVASHPVAELFRGFVAPYLRGRVLDIGPGPQPVPWYLEGYPTGWIAGIDPLAPPMPHPFTFVQGVAEFLPWGHRTFDVAIAATTLDHLLVPGKALEEIHRVLKPEGRFLVWVSFVDQAPRYDPYAETVQRVDAYHLFHYTRESFEWDVGARFVIEDAIAADAASRFYALTPRPGERKSRPGV